MNLRDFYRNKKVLVTGASGFKGSWLSSILIECRANVCGISLEPEPNSLFNILDLEKRIKFHICDVRDFDKMLDIFLNFKPEVVFHLAAQPLVIKGYQEPRYTHEVNIMGTVNLCECIRKTPSVKSFINVTTDKVYENLELEEYKYSEDDKLNGFDPYSNSKSCSDLITQSYIKSFFCNSKVRTSICRAGNVIGGGDFAKNRIIPDCVKSAYKGEKMTLRNPSSIRPYQHVLEADMFYLKLAMLQINDDKFSGNYNIGPDERNCISSEELTMLFGKYWIGEFDYFISPKYKELHEATYLKLDTSKAKTVLNWKPKWLIDETVKNTVEWYRSFFYHEDMIAVTKNQIVDFMRDTYE